jgi:predicted ATPase
LLGQLQDDPGRHRLELDLQVARGAALIAAKGFAAPETGRAWARALELCRGLPDSPPLPHVLYGVWAFHLNRAELDVALKVAGEVRTLGDAGGDPVLRLMGHRALGNTLVSRGEVVRGRAELERALAIDLPPDRRLGLEYTFHPRVSSLGFIGWALVALGYPDQALSRAREAVATARELRNPNSLAQALFLTPRSPSSSVTRRRAAGSPTSSRPWPSSTASRSGWPRRG